MTDDIPDGKAYQFLVHLHQQLEGNLTRAVSMYELGAALGFDRDAASNLAQELMASGHVEVRTLAGDIGLTASGIEVATAEKDGGDVNESAVGLGESELLDPRAAEAVDRLTTEIKANIPSLCTDFDTMSQWTADLRCLQLQIGAPYPKTAVTRALIESLATLAQSLAPADATASIQKKISQLLAA
jgi:hypothetical protein